MKKVAKVASLVVAIIVAIIAIITVLLLLKNKSNFTILEKVKEGDKQTSDELASEIFTTPESLDDFINGDVVKLQDNCYQINGVVSEKYTPSYGYASYEYSDGEVSESVTISSVLETCDPTTVTSAVSEYLNGSYQPLIDLLAIPEIKYDEFGTESTDAAEFYQYTAFEEIVPIIHDTVNQNYVMVVPCDEGYYKVISAHDFRLVNKRPTAVYDNPSERSMHNYTYSTYELDAINNTRAALDEDGTLSIDTTIVSSNSSDDSSKYTSMPDQYTREAMLKYQTYKWNSDGTTDDSSDVLDISSAAAIASQWTLESSSPYSWTNCGMKLAGLSATRSNTNFVIKGTVTNLLSNQRPWVLVIKYLDTTGKLLYVSCLDRTSDTLEPYGNAEFSYTLDESKGVNLNAIQTLQFEMY